ncbi:MAG: hypothetical protein A3D92_00420 [Bacteroidetes bacterium RIFCSPHIGHO2_02_FULL_44_7]|nr:MAG: hypothetical protein A3D92_00420 [Bacteroidetes bacterium RIFCSPHIGHO2_02_FULL_44_7]
MKNTKNSIPVQIGLGLLVINTLMLGACETNECPVSEQMATNDAVTNIEGEYLCTGGCIMNNESGERVVVTVSGEKDSIEHYPGADENLYQVRISGANQFYELEMGALSGKVLRTATAEVSDSTYPVLEEYVFDTDASGKVVGFTKTVRNPDATHFKTCVIYGKKVSK